MNEWSCEICGEKFPDHAPPVFSIIVLDDGTVCCESCEPEVV